MCNHLLTLLQHVQQEALMFHEKITIKFNNKLCGYVQRMKDDIKIYHTEISYCIKSVILMGINFLKIFYCFNTTKSI